MIGAMDDVVVAIDDPLAADVRALLEHHLDFCRGCTRPEDVHALDLDGLLDPAVVLFSACANGELLGGYLPPETLFETLEDLEN